MEISSSEWDQVKALFHSMLDMEPSARLEFLNRQQLNPNLRGMLDDLLQANEEAGSFLGARELFAASMGVVAHSGRIQLGTLLAERFRIVRFCARGGMGEVYEAEDIELRMPVAIKVIRPEIADYPGMLARFRREVHLAKQVTHPNACRIFDLFRHHDPATGDVLFLSMELLSGPTLAERIRERGRLPEPEAILLLTQTASALGAAHAAGILHRDLKPGNILIETDRDGALRAVITDFGMAWSCDSSAMTTLTASRQLAFGTPEFMSPEQIEGKTLTPASDLYCLGLIAYMAITGVRAFDADSQLFSALRRLIEPPPLPSRVVQDLHPEWDHLIARCLQRDPTLRPSSAAEVAELLDHLSHGRDTRSKPAISGIRPFLGSQPLLRRGALWANPGWRSLLTIAVGLLLAAWATFFVRRRHLPGAAPENLTLVLADFVNTTGLSTFDHGLDTALAAKLQQTPYLTLLPEQKIHLALRYMRLPEQERLTLKIALQVCQREDGQDVLQGFLASTSTGYIIGIRAFQCSTGKQIAVQQAPVEFRDSVLDALDRVAEALRPNLGEPSASILKYDVPLVEATTPSMEALTAFAQGTQVWNTQGEAAALPYFLHATEIDPNFAMAYARLGTVYGNMGETLRANQAMQQAFDRRDRVTEWERFYIVSHYYGFVTGEVDKEMETYQKWASAYPHDMAWTINLSVDYAFTGQYERAIELQRRAIAEIPGLSPSYGNLAQLYLAVERPDEARSVLDQAHQLNLHDLNIQLDEYDLAFYTDDKATMNQLLVSASRFPGVEDTLLAQQAATEDRAGQLLEGNRDAQQAASIALRAGDAETRANWLAGEALRQAELGALDRSRHLAALALATPSATQGSDLQLLLALAATYTGDTARAQSLLHSLSAAHPLDTLIQSYWLPILRARIAYAQGLYPQAISALEGTHDYDLGIFTPGQCMDAAFTLGQVLLAEHQPVAAAAAFRSILLHRGLVLNCPTSALAQLGLARALRQSGDLAASRTAYQDVLALWKDADDSFLLRRRAMAEYRSIQ